MAVYDEGFAPAAGVPRVTNIMNFAGAAMSLALIVGVSFWGYKLIMRDVSGIPVVRAIEGDMRTLPDKPGGAVAVHTGLAVNEVAAVGEAGGPEDRLVLAPQTMGLTREDLEAQPMAEVAALAPEPQEEDATVDQISIARDDVSALAAQLASLAVTPEPAPVPTIEIIPASVPGLTASLRPVVRPTSSTVAAPVTDEVAVTTASFPAGTNLVQLGAFPNPTLAGQEWERLQSRFGQLVANKSHFIEVSSQSAGTWYRLRASGFADHADARRLCAALQAEAAECIAVVAN